MVRLQVNIFDNFKVNNVSLLYILVYMYGERRYKVSLEFRKYLDAYKIQISLFSVYGHFHLFGVSRKNIDAY